MVNVPTMFGYGTDLRPYVEAALLRDMSRGDEQHAHMSDSYKCDLETHARRSGEPLLPRSVANAWKMALGHDVETRMSAGLSVEFIGDVSVERGERIAWNPWTLEVRRYLLPARHAPPVETGLTTCKGCANCMPLRDETIGHLDLNAEDRWYIEVKSSWFRKVAAPVSEPHYIIQAEGYGTALTMDGFAIQPLHTMLRGNRTELVMGPTDWHRLDGHCECDRDHRNEAIKRAKEYIIRGRPSELPPEPNAQWDWLHKVCGFGACALNQNPMRLL